MRNNSFFFFPLLFYLQGGQKNARDVMSVVSVFTNLFSFLGWTALGGLIFLVILFSITLFLLVPVGLPVGLVLILSWLLYSGGSIFISWFLNIYQLTYTIFGVLLVLWNPTSLLLPTIATLWNLIMKILAVLFSSSLSLLCTKLPTDPTFNALSDCLTLVNFFAIAAVVPTILYNFIMFIILLENLLFFLLKPFICFKRTCLGNSWSNSPIHHCVFSFFTSVNCNAMCSSLALPSTCYGTTTALQWIFTSPDNFLKMILNALDFLIPFLYPAVLWVIGHSFVSPLYQKTTLYSIFFTIISTYSPGTNDMFAKLMIGLFVQFIGSTVDIFYCRFLTSNTTVCFVHDLCIAIMPKLSINWPGPGSWSKNLDDYCPDGGFCACAACKTAWASFGVYIPTIFKYSPCTIHGSCSGSKCGTLYSIMGYFRNTYNSL
ncbi:MAG: hypothetical protein ACTSUE_16745 [Promethearchaeota archaeon]